MKHALLYSTLSENSKGEPALYQVDPESGSVVLKTVICHAVNVDWEVLLVHGDPV